MKRLRVIWVANLVIAVGLACGCISHPSVKAPSKHGMPTAFNAPFVAELEASGLVVKHAIEQVITEMGLEVRWSNTTAVDGEYIVRSARELKMKIAFQAIAPAKTRLEIYRSTTDDTLEQLIWIQTRDRAAVPSKIISTGGQPPQAPELDEDDQVD